MKKNMHHPLHFQSSWIMQSNWKYSYIKYIYLLNREERTIQINEDGFINDHPFWTNHVLPFGGNNLWP